MGFQAQRIRGAEAQHLVYWLSAFGPILLGMLK